MAEFRDLAREFFAWRARQQPLTGDDIPRIERPEGWVPDWSLQAIERYRLQRSDFLRRLSSMDPTGWSRSDRVDYLLLRSAVERVRWELEVLRSPYRDPNFYVEQTLGLIFEGLLRPPPFDEVRADQLIRRFESIPRTLTQARLNLTDPVAPLARIALANLAEVGERIARVQAGLSPLIPQWQRAALAETAVRSAEVLEDYAAWLRRELPGMQDEFAIGRELYDWFLRVVALYPYDSDEILRMGEQAWNRSLALEAYESQRNTGLPLLRLFESAAAQMAAEEAMEQEIREFLEARGVLSVPRWMGHYRNLVLPEYLEPVAYMGVTDDLTGPSRLGEDAVSYIRPPAQDLGFFALASAMDPRPIIVHEGIPGHFFQMALSWSQPNFIRRHYFDSGANEGIGFYAEEMMLQMGLFDDSPRTREIIHRFMRLRALRVAVDVKLAIGEFTIPDGARYLAETVPMDEATAREEAGFFAATPGQAISYQIGKLQIIKFLADARLQKGDRFSLREFHDYLWLNGNVPIALQRYEYLGLEDEVSNLW